MTRDPRIFAVRFHGDHPTEKCIYSKYYAIIKAFWVTLKTNNIYINNTCDDKGVKY